MKLLSLSLNICILCALLSGCKLGQENRYSLTTTPTGQTLRLDSVTGEIAVVAGNDLIILGPKGKIQLIVGKYYKLETGDIVQYVGNQKFDTSVADILKKYPPQKK